MRYSAMPLGELLCILCSVDQSKQCSVVYATLYKVSDDESILVLYSFMQNNCIITEPSSLSLSRFILEISVGKKG